MTKHEEKALFFLILAVLALIGDVGWLAFILGFLALWFVSTG